MTAMGNYPYPSDYLTNGAVVLPAHPFTAACDALKTAASQGHNSSYSLIQGLAAASNVYKDPAGTSECYVLPADRSYDGVWDYQWCTQLMVGIAFLDMCVCVCDVGQHCLLGRGGKRGREREKKDNCIDERTCV